ncbi:hypothetical protein CS542_06245 [Pedobacter sp. IW39]|nr:hypothetical protein CS542_06245 [Pedobacter sp. IW39]
MRTLLMSPASCNVLLIRTGGAKSARMPQNSERDHNLPLFHKDAECLSAVSKCIILCTFALNFKSNIA